jgi:hypothetical protein
MIVILKNDDISVLMEMTMLMRGSEKPHVNPLLELSGQDQRGKLLRARGLNRVENHKL